MDDIMQKSMVIYLLTDTTNGMRYVGLTTQTLRKRIKEHRRKHGTYIDRAIKAHGWENFTVGVLEQCSTLDELNDRERYWIATLNTKSPNGYNLTDGGEGSLGYPLSQEAKDKISATRSKRAVIYIELGITFESVTKAATFAGVTPTSIVQSCRKPNRTAAGFHWRYLDESSGNEIARQNIIASHGKRAVRCIELDRVFPSIKEAAYWAGVGIPAIAKACNDDNKTSAGFHWAYCGAPFHSEETRKKISHGHRRSVVCIELNMVFSSITEAAAWAGVSASAITNVCKKLSNTAGGYHWEYVD